MRKHLISVSIVSVVLLVFANSTIAQQQPVEPEYTGTVFYLDSAEGKLVPLENQPGNARMKLKGLGFGGGTMLITFKGGRSSVRVKSDPQPEFVVRLEAGGLDSALSVELYVLRSNKNSREGALAKAGPMGFGAKSTLGDSQIKLSFAKYGEHSVKFTAAQKLVSGEYGISTKAAGQQGFLFGID